MNKAFIYIPTLLFLIVAYVIDSKVKRWETNEVFTYDKFGYHNYLPALFIYHDIRSFKFIDTINAKYKPCGELYKRYGLNEVAKTKNICNQYPMGVALFQMPLFILTHFIVSKSQPNIAEGYSSPYQHAAVISSLLFVVIGLFLLTLFLKHFFSIIPVVICILILGFGTNLFQYATLESGLSHPYLFFLYASILYLTHKWYSEAKLKYSILLGICIGLCAITRPLDILVFLIPLCWKSYTMPKPDYFKLHWKQLIIIIIFTFIATLPQLIYWKYVSGDWIYYSYNDGNYFEFDRFRIVHGLFSYRKGWFIYTPLAILGFIGMYFVSKKSAIKFYVLPFTLFFIIMIYMVFSWHNWFYGWSFGCRALVQTLPLLALPIASFVEYILKSKNYLRIIWMLGIAILICLNLFQTWQYNEGIIHGTSMNEAYYWNVFFKTKHDSKNEKLLKLQNEIDYEMGW